MRQIIIWKRAGGLNFNAGYFLPTYEVIYLIAKPKFKLAPKTDYDFIINKLIKEGLDNLIK